MGLDFQFKKSSYDTALAKIKEYLLKDDRENGAFFVAEAISLSHDLSLLAPFDGMKSRFSTENAKLIKLQEALKAGRNPFLQKATVTDGGAKDGQGEEPTKDGEFKKTGFFSDKTPETTLDDVAGLKAVKEQIRINVLLPLKKPEIFYKYKGEAGARIIMYGPPGCGKSFVAEAIAGELKCQYAVVVVSDILDKYVGEAPKRIKAIFEEAEHYGNVLLFFDEIDSLCASRDSDESSHTRDVMNAFLTCMSGFKPKGKALKVIIGATNRPWALDPALVRGGRLDTSIYVRLPDEEARRFFVHKEFTKFSEVFEGGELTEQYLIDALDGFSGADIKSILDQTKTRTLMRVLEANLPDGEVLKVSKEDFESALAAHHNPVTEDMLIRYESFEKGVGA